MVETRKKSRAAAAAETGSLAQDEHALTVSIPDDIDRDILEELLPDINLKTPSTEAIILIYRQLVTHATELDTAQRERDEARADAEKKDIELDQALQDKESLSKDLDLAVEKCHGELGQMKQERDLFAQEKAALQEQVSALSNSQSSSSSEAEILKRRVEDTEREKRDLMGVISRLKQEGAQRDEEIHTLRASLKEARQEHQALETQIRELRSTETATKFKVDSLTQQLQLSQHEAERSNSELATKIEEFGNYRRARHAEASSLQASYDSLSQTHNSTQASFKALQSAHTTQTRQLTQALAKVQTLSGQLAEQEAKYSAEANGLKRLVTMMEEREKQAKEVLEGIEQDWAGVGDRAERRETALREEGERERRGREQAEKRVEQLEMVLDRLGRGELPLPGRSVPGTPMRMTGSTDAMTDGIMGLSPTVAMASKAQRTGKTFTEVYADYVRLQEDYARKIAEYDHMDRTLSAVLAQIEERAPILSQQRSEYERLQSEASQLAAQLSQALSERDAQADLAQETTQKLSKSTVENDLLQKQLADLGSQVQSLLREMARREDPTIPSDEELESISVVPAENTEDLITNNLVLFKSTKELQEQNQKLLKIVRELGSRMESEEKEYRDTMEKEQGEAIREAHEAMQELAAQLDRQKKSSDSIIQAYVKERDALRAMLARSEKSGSSVGSGLHGIVNGTSEVAGTQGDLEKELAEVQSQFEIYKTEMGVDSGRLREELVDAQRQANNLGAALAKANAKIEYLTDRQRMHEDQFALHNRDIDDLTKRNQQLFDQWTRMDIECNRVSEDLQIAAGRVEQLRNECANLRAEKKIWDSVQGRLVDENKTLVMERSHLSDLMANVQKMHADLERSGENDRRRLESQLQMLEGQTQDLRSQLVQERDAIRHLSLQKEIEVKELHNRLDKNAQELSKTRESLIGAETSKKHLEDRVEELNRLFKGNEEKLAVYERRSNGAITHVDPDLSREQQLEVEVAELRSTLKITEVDLGTARSHVQQFQEISRANEDALANLNNTYDEYRASTEAQITRHESEVKSLQERLTLVQEELAQFTAKYNSLQKSLETERTTWLNDKKVLEDTIVDMSTSEKHSESDRSSREQEMRYLEDRTKAAEDRYSHEVVAHAESIKAIEILKQELGQAQSKARETSTALDTAQVNLATSEGSWKQQKDALDKEVEDLNARCRDLASQNSILHQHLESVSTQASRIKQAAESTSTLDKESESPDDADTKMAELRSVVAYLRKEKEIVDLQLELSKQENTRLKAQIEHLSQTLQETRTTLSEERERAVENAASAAQHAELMERINQLNILRESNATLRTDCESQSKRTRDLEVKLKTLSEQLDPAKENARVAQAELQACKVQMQRLEQESLRWQERNSQLLSKYDRIDPAELQALKDEVERLTVQLSEVRKNFEQAEVARNEAIAQKTASEETLRKQKEGIQTRDKFFKSKISELNQAKATFTEEKNQLLAKVNALEAELQTFKSSSGSNGTNTSDEVAEQASTITSLREERDKLLTEKASWSQVSGTTSAMTESEKTELIKARDDALVKLKAATEEAQKAAEEIKNVRMQNIKFTSRIQEIQKAKHGEAERISSQQAAAVSEAVEKTKKELQHNVPSSNDELIKQHAEELEQLKLKHETELKTAVNTAVQAALKNRQASDSDGGQEAAVSAALAEYEKTVQARHVEEIAQAVERGRMEQATKTKLKDSQLFKAQKKVKDLESQIMEWKNAGILPDVPTPAAAPPGTPTTPTTSSPVTRVTTGAPSPSTNTPVSTAPNQTTGKVAGASPTVGLPRKPSMGTPTAPGAGRGIALGGAVNMAKRTLGGTPLRPLPVGGAKPVGQSTPGSASTPPRILATAAPASSTSTPATGSATPAATPAVGMSIMGAAGKRPRDDGSPSTDDSLAKRLKPAEAIGKPPVTIRRPPPPT